MTKYYKDIVKELYKSAPDLFYYIVVNYNEDKKHLVNSALGLTLAIVMDIIVNIYMTLMILFNLHLSLPI